MKMRKVISLFYLAVFATLYVSCGRDTEQPALETDSSEAQLSGGVEGLVSMLPRDDSVPGWSRDGNPRFFDPDDLWEYINGAAEGYLLYGFEEVVTADYTWAVNDLQAVIDIYRMENPLNAFGIYAQERNPDSESTGIGVEGYLGGTALNFWAGPYYVKVTVFEESDILKQEMVKLAGEVNKKITDPGSIPVQVGYFPQKNQIPNSIKYIPKDVLGQSFLVNAFEAKYKDNNSEYKMLLIEMPDPDTAKGRLGRYEQFMSTSGRVINELSQPADGGFSGEDNFYGNVIAIRAGGRIAVVLGVPSEDYGKAAISELLGKLD